MASGHQHWRSIRATYPWPSLQIGQRAEEFLDQQSGEVTRWLYHLVIAADDVGDPYAPASLTTEGFIHCSYQPDVRESARLFFAADADLRVLQIDPRRLAVRVEVAETPRGPMPHVHGAVLRAAVVATLTLAELDEAPDAIVS